MAEVAGVDPRRRTTATIIAIIVAVGLLMIGLWAAALASIAAAKSTAMNHARVEARNLAAAFADEVAHTLDGVTAGMDVIARRMRDDPPPYDINDWGRKIPVLSFGTIQGAIIGPDGRLVSTTLDAHPQPIDLSDREFIRIHLDGRYRGMFIGHAVLGPLSHETTIQITRRVDSTDGKFLGIVLFALAPSSLTSLTTAIDLGTGGVIVLTGLDNVIRARFTSDHPDGLAGIGESIAGDARPGVFPEGVSGSYTRYGVVDHVNRLLSYRRIGGYPLVATVGLDLDDVLAGAREQTRVVLAIGGVTTIILAGLIGLLIREIRRRAVNETALAAEHAKLDRVQQIAGIGSIEVDIGTGFVRWSRGACAIFGINAASVEPNVEYILSFVHPDDRPAIMEAAGRSRALGVAAEPLEYRIVRPDGTVRSVYREYDMQFNAEGRPILRTMTFKDITQLKATEAQLLEAQRMGKIGHWISDDVSQAVTWSPQMFEIAGLPAGFDIPMNIPRKVLHPDDLVKYLEARARAIETRTASIVELRWVRPDGEIRWVHMNINPRFDGSGRCVGLFGTTQDITDIKAREVQLRSVIDQLDRVQRIAGIGNTTMDLTTGSFDWSAGACAIFGIDSKAVEPTVEYFRRFVHPDDRAKVAAAAAAAQAQGVPAPPLEYRIVRPDGAVRTVYRENDVQLDEAGHAIRRIATFKDITEIKRTEMQLRQTMNNLARAQRLSHTGSDLRDLRSDEAEWSAETYRIFGVDPNSFKPTTENFMSIVIPEDRPKILATRDEIARGETPAPFEYRIRRPSGEIRSIHRISEVIRDNNGVATQMAGTIHDITELRDAEKRQKDLERQLLHSQKLEAVGTLAGGIAHELNNALVPILALGRMTLDSLPPTSDISEDIEIMVLASQRAKDLVQGILAFSRKGEASRTEVDPVQLVRQTLSVLRATLPATLRINEEMTPVPPLVADGDALQQVLVNLVTNAAHAIGNATGTITVAVEVAAPEQMPNPRIGKEFIRIRVTDTGCGMDATTVQRIFEPFFTTKGVGEGTGLGLSVAHGIVADHDGQIDVTSEPGKGSEFSIYLPSSAASAPRLVAVA